MPESRQRLSTQAKSARKQTNNNIKHYKENFPNKNLTTQQQ